MRVGFAFLAALCWFSIMSANVQGDQALVRDIGALIEQIKQETDSSTQYDLAEELADAVNQLPTSEQIDDRMIDDMASLLGDRAARIWVAVALGDLGPRAKRAVPALEKALKEEEAEESAMILGPDVSTADGIRMALNKIGAPPPE